MMLHFFDFLLLAEGCNTDMICCLYIVCCVSSVCLIFCTDVNTDSINRHDRKYVKYIKNVSHHDRYGPMKYG